MIRLTGKIPKQLDKPEFRFIKIRGKTKLPLEKKWHNKNNPEESITYSYDEIQDWVSKNNNYGVATGFGNLAVIDCDVETLNEAVKSELPKTLAVKTGSGGLHYYYIIKDMFKKYILYEKDSDIHLGEIQWQGQQVIGSGSIHPDTGNEYKIAYDADIAEITTKELDKVISKFSDKAKKSHKSRNGMVAKGINISINKLIGERPELAELTRIGKDLQGIHPIHGSNTKINFTIDDDNNTWFCFRHKTGGDTLSLIAMLESIVKCEDCVPGSLKGEAFKKTIKIAKKKYGYTDEELKTQELPEVERTLDDVHDAFKKWLHLKTTDHIDLALAMALSRHKKGTPIWIILIGSSGSGKSVLIRSLSGIPDSRMIDEITSNTLASAYKYKGKAAKDLGYYLQNKSTMLLTADLASLTSKNRDEKRAIWAKFRELFDGYVNKESGNEVIKAYEDCHVTWLMGAVPAIRTEILIYAELGTRELMYELGRHNAIDMESILEKSWDNESYEDDMKKELGMYVRQFVKCHVYDDDIKVSSKIKKFIMSEANRLEFLRASAPTDSQTCELISHVEKADSTRSMKQLKKIYIALKSLSPDYPDEKAMRIIKHVVDSSSDKIRTEILNIFIKNKDSQFTIIDLEHIIKVGYRSIKRQVMALWDMGIIERLDDEPSVEYNNFHKPESSFQLNANYDFSQCTHLPPTYQNNKKNKAKKITNNSIGDDKHLPPAWVQSITLEPEIKTDTKQDNGGGLKTKIEVLRKIIDKNKKLGIKNTMDLLIESFDAEFLEKCIEKKEIRFSGDEYESC